MNSAILYKEWIKTRVILALLLTLNLGYALYALLRLRHVFVHNEAVMVWSSWIYKGYTFYGYYEKIPLVTAIVLALSQFLPELASRRMRLSLHLPMGEDRVVGLHLLAGLMFLVGIFAPALLLMYAAAFVWFPAEFVYGMFYTSSPWILAAIAAYMFTSAVLMESRWTWRVSLALMGAASVSMFFNEIMYSAYERVLAVFVIWTLLTVFIPLLSSQRFRKGV